MEFFVLWLTTRLRENGWPRSKGIVRRRRVVDDRAIAEATADAVRVALALGSALPDFARDVAVEFSRTSRQTVQADVELWIADAAERGVEKLQALISLVPAWRRFVSITAVRGDARAVFPWLPDAGSTVYEWDSSEAYDAIQQGLAAAGIALGWSLRNPIEARGAFDDDGSDAFEAWRILADLLATRYESAGLASRYDELPAGRV